MSTIFLYLFTMLVYLHDRVNCEENVLSYELLSDGQKIVVPLQQYFSNASSAQINDEKSTNKYDDKFTVFNTSDKPYRTAFDQQLSFLYKGKIISFRNLQSYTSKSLYNQPIKLYLLTSNFLMMVIYNEHCGDYNENKVIGINLTQYIPDTYKIYKNITCTSLETITTNEQEFQDLAYVVCRGLEQNRDNKYYSYFVVKVLLTHNDEGFIQGFKIVNYTLVANRSQSCLEYTLKFFDTLRVSNSIIPQRIWLFCRQKNNGPQQPELIRYFYDIQKELTTQFNRNLTECLVNSKYISANGDGGFLSVINQKVYEYYTNTTKYESMCVATSLDKIDYEFAANRNYNNIQITYFFLKNATIIIKSSYRTNHQKLDLNKTNYSFTSYAITEHYMAVSLCNNLGTTIMLVYEMEDLFPKLIDERIVQTNQTCNNFVLTSTNNYLEKGYYVFFYNKTTNTLSLKQYNGYILVIKPKPQKFQQPSNEILPYQYEEGKIIQAQNVLMKRQNSNVYVFYIQIPNSNENLTIKLIIRRFNNSNIQFLPFKKLNFDSPYVNFDLSTVAIGPLQRFYLDDTLTDKSVKLKFINYYSTINISSILQKKNAAGKIQALKQLALNIQLKVINPVLTLYYHTFIQNCNIKYDKNNEFTIDCLNQNVIKIKNSTQRNQNKIIVLTKDKWLQYSNKTIQYCYILGDSGQCEKLPFLQKNPLDVEIQIRKIKLIRFEQKSHSTYIELFIIYMRGYSSELGYGYFNKQQSSNQFKWSKIFVITPKQVGELSYMELTNVHFDKNYNHYLLLHLSTEQTILKHVALLYDHPGKIDNGYFLGHLIQKFDDNTIQSILTIGNFLIIIRRYEDEQAEINEFKITEFYSVVPTRTYPLYGRKIIKNGSHIADGQFLFIEVLIENGQSEGNTQYIVFCPSLKTTNILTHTLPKSEASLLFAQQIGSIINNKYPHSIGINGKNLFALSVPNLVVKFEYDSKKQDRKLVKRTQLIRNKENEMQSVQKIYIPGNFSLRLIDYQNIMYAFTYEYEFDISNQAIEYNESSISLNISQQNGNSSYSLKIDQIKGPVMEIDMKVDSKCPFIKKNIQSEDIFTQLQCLSQIDSKKYGTILDLKSLKVFNQNSSIDIIITTQHFLCVQNHQIQYFLNITYRACLIVSYNNSNGKGLFVCDNGQGSVINTFSFSLSSTLQICHRVVVNQNITKPSWLIYQYFKMRYIHPYAIFEVPIRIEANKIYFLTKFDIFTGKFIDRYQSLIYNNTNQIDHFLTKDFEVDQIYAYLLEDGLGIYDLDNIQVINSSISQPLAWIPSKNITQTLGSSSELVYIKPDAGPHNSDSFNCSFKFNKKIFIEIGTVSRAYQVKICFNDDDGAKKHQKNTREGSNTSKIQQFQMTVLIQYNQYKDCKNTVLSKSKSWQNLTMKLCALQIQQHRIFSNYMPITPRTSQYYMQFYSVNQNELEQKLYPFRMQKISTNDTIQINLLEGQLLVKSLFSFLCYYKLATEIKWTFFRDVYDNETSELDKSCTANIILSNENFQKVVSISINNNDLQLQYHYQPWIYRCFFLLISLISIIKLRMFLLHKNIKLNKLKFNLLSNEFEFNVRVNSKKDIEKNLLERGQSQQQLDDNSFRKYQN